MPYYLIELRDSDGNDCSVYDLLIEATDQDSALAKADAFIEEEYPDDESDGNGGTFHPCECAAWCAKDHSIAKANRCPAHGGTDETGETDDDEESDCKTAERCEGHGGLLLADEPETFDTYDDVRAAHRFYHSLVDLTEAPTS
jgi:hypothetical protein